MRPGVIAAADAGSPIHYATAQDDDKTDDDLSRRPLMDSTAPGASACARRPGGLPTQDDRVHHMIQVRPNPFDLPEKRKVQLWAAVRHPNGIGAISDVSWQVYAPDGTPVESAIRGIRVPAASCDRLGGHAKGGSMFAATISTGQISADLVDDMSDGLQPRCARGEVALYSALTSVSNQQPCGEYRVEARARSGARTATLSFSIDVVCFFYLQLDFDQVGWGTLAPGEARTLTGDLTFDNPGAGSPSVRNGGNDGVAIGVTFTPMRNAATSVNRGPGSTRIDQFGACFGRSPSAMQCGVASGPVTTVVFDDQRDLVLCANEVGRLDLTVQTRDGLTQGQYRGGARIVARPALHIC